MPYALNRKILRPEKWAIAMLEKAFPKRLLSECGILTQQEVEAVLDASGFAFGDQLPVHRTLHFVDGLKPLKTRNTPVVLLPQAFGPFTNPAHREAMKRLLDVSDLVFARDDVSLAHLNSLSQNDERIQSCPDLTLAFEAPVTEQNEPRRITLIPNSRMLDKLPASDSENYQVCLVKIILHARDRNIPLQLLLHDQKEDLQFVDILKERIRSNIEIVMDDDPTHLKAILASSKLVISSRFHALAGALSSGVPSISIGWSHKYEQLMSDFNQAEWSLDTTQASQNIESIMNAILQNERHDEISCTLKARMTGIRKQVNEMWQKVDQAIGLVC